MPGLRHALFAAFICAVPHFVAAGTIRDDVDPQLYLNLAAQPQYASVGLINAHTSVGDLIGSGTLIAPQFVLTAGHMVDHLSTLQFSLGGTSYTATNWLANPNWNGDLTAGYDLAVVELSSAVTNIAPAVRYSGSSELNSLGTFVGFGRTGTGLTGDVAFDQIMRAGTNMIDGSFNNNSHILTADFDNPHSVLASTQGSAAPTSLEYMIAPGDSGGGLFITTPTGAELAGVNSFGAAYAGHFNASYGNVSGDIRVSLFNSWIDDAIASLTALNSTTTVNSLAVPEPSTVRLASLGALLGLCGYAQRRRTLPRHYSQAA